ncbi:MAG TPA: hypothetical protein VME69_06270 [Methylocella sp.]|nr:hypothetical protein [Methylocella sp.]
MITLVAPEGVEQISLRGMNVEVKNRRIEVAPEYVDELRGHGFVHEDPAKEAITAAGTRQGLVTRLKAHIDGIAATMSDAQLLAYYKTTVDMTPWELHQALIKALLSIRLTKPYDTSTPVACEGVESNTESTSEKSIEEMNRVELFAYLKARAVAVSLPITNDELRRLAHEASKSPLRRERS